jgi:hypothetical protein
MKAWLIISRIHNGIKIVAVNNMGVATDVVTTAGECSPLNLVIDEQGGVYWDDDRKENESWPVDWKNNDDAKN